MSEFEKKIKNKKKRNIGIICILVVVAIVVFGTMNIETKDKAMKDAQKDVDGKNTIKVTMEIRCDNLSNNMDKLKKQEKAKWVPKDGVILKETQYTLEKDATAFDLLKKATNKENIQTEYSYTKSYDSYYVEGINHIYEFDGGKLSGWQYYVNKKYPNYGCSQYKLKNNDKVVWVYTCDNGKDVNIDEY